MGLRRKFIIGYSIVAVLFALFFVGEYFAFKKIQTSLDVNRSIKNIVNNVNNEHSLVTAYYNTSMEFLMNKSIDSVMKSELLKKVGDVRVQEEQACDQNLESLKNSSSQIAKVDKNEVQRLIVLFEDYDNVYRQYREFFEARLSDGGVFYDADYVYYKNSYDKLNQLMEQMIDYEPGGDVNGNGLDYIQKIGGDNIRKSILYLLAYNVGLALMFIATFLVMIFYLTRDIVNPILKIRLAAEKIGETNYTYADNLNIKNNDEIGWLASAIKRMAVKLRNDQKEVERMVNKVMNKGRGDDDFTLRT